MNTWVLIALFYAYGGGVTTAVVPGFSSEQECKDALAVIANTKLESKGVCVRQSK
jgi:hypothetical protein